jgi:hypothetical protein
MGNVPDAIFPHTSELEIPLLLPEYQADFVDLPIRGWGSVSRRSRFRGTWHFYTHDYKFDTLWKKPDALLKTRCCNIVEPNFTTDHQMPYPVVLYRTYQKRWLARYWQEKAGIGVFVDLNVAPGWDEVNLHGVPDGWQSYATGANDTHLDELEKHAEIARRHAAPNMLRLLVYGGAKKTAQLCEQNDWVHVYDARNEVRDG